jgi:hypothetical protein
VFVIVGQLSRAEQSRAGVPRGRPRGGRGAGAFFSFILDAHAFRSGTNISKITSGSMGVDTSLGCFEDEAVRSTPKDRIDRIFFDFRDYNERLQLAKEAFKARNLEWSLRNYGHSRVEEVCGSNFYDLSWNEHVISFNAADLAPMYVRAVKYVDLHPSEKDALDIRDYLGIAIEFNTGISAA